eukprot:1159218-Pelagomonas_calceolata.AAC.1
MVFVRLHYPSSRACKVAGQSILKGFRIDGSGEGKQQGRFMALVVPSQPVIEAVQGAADAAAAAAMQEEHGSMVHRCEA